MNTKNLVVLQLVFLLFINVGRVWPAVNESVSDDPWVQLHCFTHGIEISEMDFPHLRWTVSMKRYWPTIKEACRTFNVPEEIVLSLIHMESGGDPLARGKGTTARGLMQTVRGTFAFARQELEKKGIWVPDDPHDPTASIFTGTYFLNYCYELTPSTDSKRHILESWRDSLEYYFVGPAKGRQPDRIVTVIRQGRKFRVNKRAYSDRVIKRATEALSARFATTH